jgi:adenine phosphoribosyltransferase
MPEPLIDYRDHIRKLTGRDRYDLTPLLADRTVFHRAVHDLAAPFQGRGVAKVAALDALGFALGGGVAHALDAGLVLIRKEEKVMWHAETVSVEDYSRTVKTFALVRDAIRPGEKVLVVDDWSETGAQLRAAFRLVERSRGRVAGAALLHVDEPVRRDPDLAGYTLHHLFDY